MIYTITKTKTIVVSLMIIISIIINSITCFIVNGGGSINVKEIETRTIEVKDINIKYENQLSLFNHYEIEEDSDYPSFNGYIDYDGEQDYYFDNVSLDDYNIDELQVQMNCKFDMENLIYTFTINLMDYDYNIIESETQETKAFVTETGGLDAYIEIEGETYLLSELESESQIDECAFFTWIVVIVVIVVVYHVVTETAEQIKSKENYMYNKALDGTKDGMYYKKYITSQDIRTIDEVKFDSKEKVTFTDPITGETKKTNKFKSYTYLTKYEYIDYSPSIYDGARAGNYKFGFTFFDGVGCEVAAVYNLLIAKGNTKPLSEVIYLFEQKAIEFAFAWGHFGSNCFQIDNILDYYDIDYVQYDSFDSFKEAYDKSINKYAIMSRWNSKLLGGYHTYMIKQVTNTKTETINLTGVANSRKKSGTIEIVKIVNQMYYGYNHDYYLNEASASIYDSSNDLSFFNDGLFYIVGYII